MASASEDQQAGQNELSADEPDWPEDTCGQCVQQFNSQDEDKCSTCWYGSVSGPMSNESPQMRSFWLNLQDAVEGTPLLVATAKGGAKGECLRCYYIRRGSFKDLDAAELRTLIFKNPALKTKSLCLAQHLVVFTWGVRR